MRLHKIAKNLEKQVLFQKTIFSKSDQVSISKQAALFIDPIFSEGFASKLKVIQLQLQNFQEGMYKVREDS